MRSARYAPNTSFARRVLRASRETMGPMYLLAQVLLMNIPAGGTFSEWAMTSLMHCILGPDLVEHRLSVGRSIWDKKRGGENAGHREGVPDIKAVTHTCDEDLGVCVREDRGPLFIAQGLDYFVVEF